MDLTNAQRAEVLVHALPYIQKYADKILVVKYGGNAMINEQLKQAVMGDIVLLSQIGVKVVLVHGGGPEINSLLNRLGKQSSFIDGLRVTDEETIEAVQMVLAGKVNKGLVEQLHLKGAKAIGLCGIDGGMLTAKCSNPRLGFVGEITEVNTRPICDLLDKGYIPVISSLATDGSGNALNINADTAAGCIAGALHAESLILMTDTAGILRDKNDVGSLMSEIRVSETPNLIRSGIIQGGMLPKIECAADALRRGVRRVFILDGRVPHSILIETLTDEGIGTMLSL